MDLFKRIQNLSAIYDDDGPSAMVPESRPMFADSVRPGFYRGESVVKSHGQKLIELTEAGESSVSIAKKLGLKQQTVSNALNAIDSGTAGDEYKLSKPLKDFFKPKNQFSGKELTKNTELIEAIKEDAPTMSDKEIKAKYDIHKSTLKKIKDENDITTRSSYLPEGKQKKSIPYAERYTAQEKSDMYKKRKDTETEEDRIKAKERDKKYRDKKFKEYKMEPSSRTPYDDLWKDITRSSKEGDRIQLIEGPKYSSGASYDDFKTRVFLDTKTGETFNYNNLKQYLDSGKLEGVSYNSVIEPYNIKNQIAKSGLKEDIQKAYFGEKYKPPKPFRAQNTFHVHHIGGVASDPFNVQLTFADQNLGLVTNKKFNKEWASLIERNAPLSERKNYLKFVKSKIGENIAQTLEFPEVGKTRTFGEIGTDMQKLLSNEKFEVLDKTVMKKIMVFCPAGTAKVTKAGGGRVPYADGPVCTPDEAIRGMNEEFDKLKKGNATTGEASRTVNKFKNLGVKGMSGLLKAGLVSEVAYEAALGFDKVISEGQSPMQAFRQSYLTAPLRAIGAMKSFEEGEREEILDAARDKGKVGRVLDLQNLVGDKNKLASNIQGLKSNVEDLQRLDDGDFGYMGGTQGQEDALASAQANLQDMYRSGELSKAEQLFSTKPQDLKLKDKTLMDAYNDAIEKRRNIQAERSSIAQSIAADKNRVRDANKAMLEKFPIYTPEIIDSMYERAKVEKPENLDYVDFGKQMSDYDKMNYFADNFRTEKAGGGIAGLSGGDPKGAMTTSMNPDSQGLQGLFNRVKKV
jgi:hypothetical protein